MILEGLEFMYKLIYYFGGCLMRYFISQHIGRTFILRMERGIISKSIFCTDKTRFWYINEKRLKQNNDYR